MCCLAVRSGLMVAVATPADRRHFITHTEERSPLPSDQIAEAAKYRVRRLAITTSHRQKRPQLSGQIDSGL